VAGIGEFLDIGQFGLANRQLPPNMVGRFAGRRCMIAGGARCVWADMAALGVRGGADNGGWDVMCVNDIVMHYPGRVRHFYSNDHYWMPRWLAARRELLTKRYGGVDHTHSCGEGGQSTWPWPGHGSSALGAVYTALAMGYAPVVLVGVPLDNQPHYFHPDWELTNFQREVGAKESGDMMYWSDANRKLFRGRVRSMSGRTRELLGVA